MNSEDFEGYSAKGTFTSAPTLFTVATDAYQRTGKAYSDRSPGQLDALVSVVFSVIALEAFINDLGALAAISPQLRGPSTLILADIIEEIEADRGSIQSKMFLAKSILSGTPYDKGAQPYQDFSLLVALRNELVHVRDLDGVTVSYSSSEGWQLESSSRMADKFRSRNIIAEIAGFPPPIHLFTTRAVAEWACNTTVKMVHSILISINDDDELKEMTDSLYFPHFEQVGPKPSNKLRSRMAIWKRRMTGLIKQKK